MHTHRTLILPLLLLLALLVALGQPLPAAAQKRKIQNRPFIDTRIWHYGFNIGVHDQSLKLINNGYIDPVTGEQWIADCDRQNFGFNVGVLGSLKLCKWADLRVNPSLSFGSKHIYYSNIADGSVESQDMKSTYIGVPVDLKLGAPRCNNFRPYALVGASVQYDLTSGKHTQLRAKPLQGFLEAGMGCEVYMPFFKFIPELKFCFGLGNVLNRKRNDITDPTQAIFTQSVDRMTTNMVMLNFYIE